jgi:hypothetical protein
MFFRWLQNVFFDVFQRDVKSALLFFGISGLLCLSVVGLLVVFVRLLKKRKRCFALDRNVEFTLPDRENTYVRARLATVLNPNMANEEEKEEELPITFAHAKTLLNKIWFAPLSQAERLEMQSLENSLKKYENRTSFNAKEVRNVNDVFLRLLKLSAKYNV